VFFLQVVDIENGNELGPNKEGEICVKGPTVMKGEENSLISVLSIDSSHRVSGLTSPKDATSKFSRVQF